MSVKRAGVRLTEKGNVKLTLSKRQAQLIMSLLGPTYGDLSYSIFGPMADVMENPGVFESRTRLCDVCSDEVLVEVKNNEA